MSYNPNHGLLMKMRIQQGIQDKKNCTLLLSLMNQYPTLYDQAETKRLQDILKKYDRDKFPLDDFFERLMTVRMLPYQHFAFTLEYSKYNLFVARVAKNNRWIVLSQLIVKKETDWNFVALNTHTKMHEGKPVGMDYTICLVVFVEKVSETHFKGFVFYPTVHFTAERNGMLFIGSKIASQLNLLSDERIYIGIYTDGEHMYTPIAQYHIAANPHKENTKRPYKEVDDTLYYEEHSEVGRKPDYDSYLEEEE